jgi:hypothetical protein
VYSSEDDLLFRSGALDELDLQRFYGITGQHYKSLIDRFQQISTGEKCDTFAANVSIGGAKGLYTIFEAVVMRGEDGQLWEIWHPLEGTLDARLLHSRNARTAPFCIR